MKKIAVLALCSDLCGAILTGCGHNHELEEKGRQVKESFVVFRDSVGEWLSAAWDGLWPG